MPRGWKITALFTLIWKEIYKFFFYSKKSVSVARARCAAGEKKKKKHVNSASKPLQYTTKPSTTFHTAFTSRDSNNFLLASRWWLIHRLQIHKGIIKHPMPWTHIGLNSLFLEGVESPAGSSSWGAALLFLKCHVLIMKGHLLKNQKKPKRNHP